ncbi:circadian locomoter output cycles protein kaput isoform X1 [Nasonia vitripennis]|uniref:Clock n=1 Tax=Nasonia vitripennis TaxID=7425 RepID=A0A7M7PYG3_NASVI|nr:circadian locomoter output cycles protein kaput isoform X1 [Nasonia vitripennis]
MASCIRNRNSTRHCDEAIDDDNDEKDDTKRKSRNLSEKKRRDQFNMLVNELGSMVNTNTRKMDKSSVLKSTILFLKNHNGKLMMEPELAVRSRTHEIQEDWKPSFLSNEEFTHLTLEALDGFIMLFSLSGRIFYVSESITSLLGYLPSELTNTTIYEIALQEDQSHLYNTLANASNTRDQNSIKTEHQVSFTCHIKRGGLDFREEPIYELVQFIGYFRTGNDADVDNMIPNNRFGSCATGETKTVFVCTGRLQVPQLIREMSVVDNTKTEFTSKHSLEWKFLFLDHRAPPIIGYLPFEVLGTSGYDYYHIDDLDKVVTCHESLMKKGEGTSCYYRFLTKGQQWIWLQTRFYITYNQWHSNPEFIVCTHHVVSYTDVVKHLRIQEDEMSSTKRPSNISSHIRISSWSAKSSKTSRPAAVRSLLRHQSDESDSTAATVCSKSSQSFQSMPQSVPKTKIAPTNSLTSYKPIMPSNDNTSTDTQPQQQTHPAYQQSQPQQPQQPQEQQQQDQQAAQKMKVEQQHCSDFVEPTQFSAEPMETVVGGSYSGTTDPSLITLLQTTEMRHQPGLVITPVQNQIQDELQRKHEELQQLIVHQQEELRRVSEQLLIARYGMFSPLLNMGVPYNANLCQQPTHCSSTPNHSVPGVTALAVPIALPLNIVPPELFPHSPSVNTVLNTSISDHSNVIQMMTPQQQQQQQQQRQQLQIRPHQQLTQQHQPKEQTTDIIAFQMCQQNDLL